MHFYLAVGSYLIPGTRKVERLPPTKVGAKDHAAACVSMASFLSAKHGKRITPDFVRGNVRLTVVA